jgi:hypothetical protein
VAAAPYLVRVLAAMLGRDTRWEEERPSVK